MPLSPLECGTRGEGVPPGPPTMGFSASFFKSMSASEFQCGLPLPQESAHGVVAFETYRHLIGFTRFAICAGPDEKFGTSCPVRLILMKPRIGSDALQQLETFSGPTQLRNRQRTIDG